MAWLRKRRATLARPSLAPKPLLPVDPAYGDPAAAALRAAMAAGDWPAVRDFLTKVADPDDHAFYLDVASRVAGAEAWLPRAVAAEADPTLALVLSGAQAVDWAWQARGAARAKYVGRDQFEVFFERLKYAEGQLFEALRHDPDSVSAWATLITVARGRQLGLEEAYRRFGEATVRHPQHLRAHVQLLQHLCPKWSRGSYEAMHDFARESMMKAPAGSRLGYLVAIGHLEHWLDLDDGAGAAYLTSSRVRAELHEAADRSVRHPTYQRRAGWPVVHNTFAMAFSLAGESRAAAEQFQVIGDLVTVTPWRYLNSANPGAPFLARRAAAVKAAWGA
jgi:hypothetical protein